jgi:hypothetical protein
MNDRQRANELLAKVRKYRRLARTLTDSETAGRIWQLTNDLENQADQLAQMLHEERIRTRAHQLWVEQNRPAGRDDEFWLEAERELGKHPEPDDLESSRLS